MRRRSAILLFIMIFSLMLLNASIVNAASDKLADNYTAHKTYNDNNATERLARVLFGDQYKSGYTGTLNTDFAANNTVSGQKYWWASDKNGNPIYSTHTGLDLRTWKADKATGEAKEVYTPISGKVTYVGGKSGYICIYNEEHDCTFILMHMSESYVAVNDTVKLQQKIGKSGKKGTGSYHLHVSLRAYRKTADSYCPSTAEWDKNIDNYDPRIVLNFTGNFQSPNTFVKKISSGEILVITGNSTRLSSSATLERIDDYTGEFSYVEKVVLSQNGNEWRFKNPNLDVFRLKVGILNGNKYDYIYLYYPFMNININSEQSTGPYTDFIVELQKYDILPNRDGQFYINQMIKRWEMAEYMLRMIEGGASITNVDGTEAHNTLMDRLAYYGVINKQTNKADYRAEDNISRQEFCKIIYNTAKLFSSNGLSPKNMSINEELINTISSNKQANDLQMDNKYYDWTKDDTKKLAENSGGFVGGNFKQYIWSFVNSNIISGQKLADKRYYLRPESPISKGEVAKIMKNTFYDGAF